MVKRTYSIDAKTAASFEKLIPPGKRSEAITEGMTRLVEQLEKQALRNLIEAGLLDMAEENKLVATDWSSVDLVGWPLP